MLRMTPDQGLRGKAVDLPSWWLAKVGELVDERGESMTQLGQVLADAVGRATPWDHGQVSRFLRGINTTQELAEAFSILLGVPRPFYIPRSLDEAIALTATAKRYEEKNPATSAEQSRRLAEVDALLEQEKRAALDRSNRPADDGRLHGSNQGGGRSRRTSRRRVPPTRS